MRSAYAAQAWRLMPPPPLMPTPPWPWPPMPAACGPAHGTLSQGHGSPEGARRCQATAAQHHSSRRAPLSCSLHDGMPLHAGAALQKTWSHGAVRCRLQQPPRC